MLSIEGHEVESEHGRTEFVLVDHGLDGLVVLGALPVLVLGVFQVLPDGEDGGVCDLGVVYAHVEGRVSFGVQ